MATTAALFGGCGGGETDARAPATSALPAAPARAAKVDAFSGKDGLAQFQNVAGTVCATALTGLPEAPALTRPSKRLRTYATVAIPALGRLDQSLATLAQQRPESAAGIGALRAKLLAVSAALETASGLTKGDVQRVQFTFAQAQQTAGQIQLPGCAPR